MDGVQEGEENTVEVVVDSTMTKEEVVAKIIQKVQDKTWVFSVKLH